jgi:hypothetical protein
MSSKSAQSDFEMTLKKLEARVEGAEKDQQTTTQRMETLYQTLLTRLTTKDESIDRLKDQSEWILRQNDTLLKQVGFRWNLLTGLTTLVGLAFTVTLGYQIWRVEQVMDTKRALEQGTIALAQNTKLYSEVLSKLAEADNVLTESNREFQRSEYKSALKLSSTAIELLKQASQKTNLDVSQLVQSASYDNLTCAVKLVPSEKKTVFIIAEGITSEVSVQQKEVDAKGIEHALTPTDLQTAVRDELFTAYDMNARAAFFLDPQSRDIQPVRENGRILAVLNQSRWEGYHWLGLAAESPAHKDFAEASACFGKSVELNSTGNKDSINLAELNFLQSKYDKALEYSEGYLGRALDRFISPNDVVAQFYASSARLILGDNKGLSPKDFRQKVSTLHKFTTEGTFSSIDIDSAIKNNELKASVEQIKEIQASLDCLTQKKCGDDVATTSSAKFGAALFLQNRPIGTQSRRR